MQPVEPPVPALRGPPPPLFQLHRLPHAPTSRYDAVIRRLRAGESLPHGLAILSGSGDGFQGFHGRGWAALPGNLHLTVHLAPGRAIERFESVFLALAAVAVVDAIDQSPGLAGVAGIRWVNDVLVSGAKVGGVLAHTQTRGSTVTSVVLGIGLNVEVTPEVAPTPFVPRVGSLRGFAPAPAAVRLEPVLQALLGALQRRYEELLAEGWPPIVARYRERSLLLGRRVTISADDPDQCVRPLASGRVTGIGDGLELHLEGLEKGIWQGRVVQEDG